MDTHPCVVIGRREAADNDDPNLQHSSARWKVLSGSFLLVSLPCLIIFVAGATTLVPSQPLDEHGAAHRLLQQLFGNASPRENRIFTRDRSANARSGDEAALLSVQDHMDSQSENSKKPFEGSSPMDPNLPYTPSSDSSDTEQPADSGGIVAIATRGPVPTTTVCSAVSRSGNGVLQSSNSTFKLGLINTIENGLLLSEGLKSRVIAESGRHVRYHNREQSPLEFHEWPDGGDVFVDTRPENQGGWILISNSEEDREGQGGVGAITFDCNGNVIDYRMVLTGTTMNCNGGTTHFGAWISAEEDFWSGNGKVWQVDPTGLHAPQMITLGSEGGVFEAFAEDVRDLANPRYFLTEDDEFGAMQRFIPDNPDWTKPWEVLLGTGIIDYLVLLPNQNDHNNGIYTWIPNKRQARNNAALYYPNSEGLARHGNSLYMVCKKYMHLYTLDLDRMTYTRQSTQSGLFDGTPDQLRIIIGPPLPPRYATRNAAGTEEPEKLLFFTEDGGAKAGIHARNSKGEVFTVLEGMYAPETTGLSFSPDGTRMYFAFQEDGMMFEVQRIDGLPFHATTMNLKNHQFEGSETPAARRELRDRIRRERQDNLNRR